MVREAVPLRISPKYDKRKDKALAFRSTFHGQIAYGGSQLIVGIVFMRMQSVTESGLIASTL